MQETNQYILYLISSTVLLILSIIVSFRHKSNNHFAGIFLSGYFWSFFLSASITYVVLSPLIDQMPHLFRLANIFFLLVMPFSWLYVRETLFPGKISWKDLIHLLPSLLYIIDYMPFFLLSGQEKINILHSLNGFGIKAKYGEGWFMPAGSHNLIRYIVMLGYWFAQGVILLKAVRLASVETGKDFLVQRKWLMVLQLSEPLIFMPAIITLLLGNIDIMVSVTNFFGLVCSLIQGSFLLMNPKLLYGIPVDLYEQKNDDSNLQGLEMDSNNLVINDQRDNLFPAYIENLDESTLNEIGEAIDKVMLEKKLYLDPNFKISELAMASGFLSYKLSAYFKKRCNQTFNDYVNQKRIDFLVQKLNLKEYQEKTLEALANESGFQSRSTFSRAFKKFKGKTPSEYIQIFK